MSWNDDRSPGDIRGSLIAARDRIDSALEALDAIEKLPAEYQAAPLAELEKIANWAAGAPDPGSRKKPTRSADV